MGASTCLKLLPLVACAALLSEARGRRLMENCTPKAPKPKRGDCVGETSRVDLVMQGLIDLTFPVGLAYLVAQADCRIDLRMFLLDNSGPGLLRDNLPHHHAMVVASNRFVSMPGASRGLRCHQFDYDAPPESLPDLHGCRLFHRSFRLLQRLRRCIAGELEASGRWQKHRKQAESGRMYEASAEVDVNSVDTFGRVDEVMKFVAVRDWKQIGSGIIDVVEKSIRKTISDVDLEASVVQKIRTKCLKVDRDDFNELSDESIVLKRALPCHAMMWDVFEVTGPPDQLLADAEHNFNPGYHTLATSMDLTRTPAICGRIATALIMRVVTHSPKGYKPVKCWLRNRHLTFEYCLHMQSHNCICAEKCWVAALEPACKLSPACCADAEKITSYTGFHVLNR
eukprot:TRINITY_DN5143_c0_g1_i3.p1 TRINITY_DN5143_c0_g1~~TRINITY_DN5143_c0_g1_i3.p1  ORF type:complete len:397 (-),score=52.65 TRINITY_DN5143_c0_g1_i3:140-1330(-)